MYNKNATNIYIIQIVTNISASAIRNSMAIS